MALKTAKEYLDTIKKMKPRVYIGGKWVKNLLDNPVTRSMVMANAAIYSLAEDPGQQGGHGGHIPSDGGNRSAATSMLPGTSTTWICGRRWPS